MAAACPWCSAPRGTGDSCPRCGANYAKAEQIKRGGKAIPVAVEPEPAAIVPIPSVLIGSEHTAVDDPKFELWMSVAGIPAALALGFLFHLVTPGLQRIVFGMPIHELGHAAGAWFCGFFAIPTLWKTLVFSDARGTVTPILLALALGYGIYRAWQAEKPAYLVLLAALLVLQGIGTLYIREETAEMVFVWGGDGIGMVLAAMLMAMFFFGKRTDLYKGALRWGFLVIGAAAFSDMFGTWWIAQWKPDVIPFGENEGTGLSDPLRLLEEYGWPTATIVRRYVTVGVGALIALALVYAWGVRRALRKARGPG